MYRLARTQADGLTGDTAGDFAWQAADRWCKAIRWRCAMHLYAAYVGDWSAYWGDYRWPPLPGARHNAIDDCRAVLELLQHMAADTIDTAAVDKEQGTNDTEPA